MAEKAVDLVMTIDELAAYLKLSNDPLQTGPRGQSEREKDWEALAVSA